MKQPHDRSHAPLLLDDLVAQLDRLRLLPGGSDADAERVLAGMTPHSPRERDAARELAAPAPLAHPNRFEESHRLVVKALEVLDRHGFRQPALPRWLGPVRPIVQKPVELVARTIVKSHERDVVTSLRRLYERREAQCAPDAPERRPLTRARIAITRLSTDFSGGSTGLPRFLVGGAVLSGVASALRGARSGFSGAWWIAGSVAAAFVVFAVVSWIALQAAGVAHRRIRLILHQPLEALWETVGNCGRPPQDESLTVAAVGIVLFAIAWLVTPLVVGAIVYLAH